VSTADITSVPLMRQHCARCQDAHSRWRQRARRVRAESPPRCPGTGEQSRALRGATAGVGCGRLRGRCDQPANRATLSLREPFRERPGGMRANLVPGEPTKAPDLCMWFRRGAGGSSLALKFRGTMRGRCRVAEPGLPPWVAIPFPPGHSVVLVAQPDQPGRHPPLDCSTKGRATAPAIGVAAAVTIPRVMDAPQSAGCHVTSIPASCQTHEAGLRMCEAATGSEPWWWWTPGRWLTKDRCSASGPASRQF
jgi:hypothetical protein